MIHVNFQIERLEKSRISSLEFHAMRLGSV